MTQGHGNPTGDGVKTSQLLSALPPRATQFRMKRCHSLWHKNVEAVKVSGLLLDTARPPA